MRSSTRPCDAAIDCAGRRRGDRMSGAMSAFGGKADMTCVMSANDPKQTSHARRYSVAYTLRSPRTFIKPSLIPALPFRPRSTDAQVRAHQYLTCGHVPLRCGPKKGPLGSISAAKLLTKDAAGQSRLAARARPAIAVKIARDCCPDSTYQVKDSGYSCDVRRRGGGLYVSRALESCRA
jgi:hypothetical protein